MRYISISPSLFKKNRVKIIKLLKPGSLVIVHSNNEMPRSGDTFFPFRQNAGFFYLTGIEQDKSILTLCPDHPLPAYREILFISNPDPLHETWHGKKLSPSEASGISYIPTIRWLSEYETILNDLMIHSKQVYLNPAENLFSESVVFSRNHRMADELMQKYPTHPYERLAPLLIESRLIKEPEEIKLLRIACDITDKAFFRVLSFIRPGVKEYEVEAELTCEMLRCGANGHAYLPIIASGKNACTLHYIKNDGECRNGDLLLMDFGAEYANYASDCTRTIPVNGKFTPRQKKIYNALLRVQKQAITMLTPGQTILEYHQKVCQLLEKEMIGLGLFSKQDVKNQDPAKPMYQKYYMHGTSHFIGLDVHDSGTKYTAIKEGMALSCEPAIYIPEENTGIRIENVILTGKTPVDLMAHIPREAEEIEAFMKKR